MDERDTVAEAMSICLTKILAIGSEKEVKAKTNDFVKISSKNYELLEIDLRGACIVPGFIDAHMHPVLSVYYKTQLKLSNIKSYSQLGQVLREETKKRSEDEWIIGFDLMENRFINPNEHFFPDKFKLDELSSNIPLIVFRYDGHICSVNSLALEKMGINKSSVKEIIPTSGEIRVDKNGHPTGVFTEGATTFAIEKAALPSQERLREAGILFTKELSSFGITTCGAIVQLEEIGIAGKMGSVEYPFIKYFLKEKIIEQDIVLYLITEKPDKLNRVKKAFLKLFDDNNDKYIVGGLKLWADGGFGASTAYMYEPFTDSSEDNTGLMVTSREKLYKIFKEAYDLGYQLACHAIGDKANDIIVGIFKKIQSESKDKNRVRIEHASLINDDTLVEAAKHGIIIVSQPLFINSEYTWLEERLGSKRIKHVYPFRSIIDSGILLAGASDAPIETPDVLRAIYVAVTRNEFVPEQSISVYEGLKMFTYNAAYALGQEDVKGSLEKGKLADFVVLNQDPTSISLEDITKTKILKTYHRGKEIFSLN